MARVTCSIVFALLVSALMVCPSGNAQAQRFEATGVTTHDHLSNSDLSIEAGELSPFFAGFPGAGGLTGNIPFANNPSTPAQPSVGTISGTVTVVGSATGPDFDNGNGLPTGLTVSYDLSFQLSTTNGALLSAGVSEANGLGAGTADAFFTPGNGNFSGNLVFGPATISNVSFTGSVSSSDFQLVAGSGAVESVDLVGLISQSFNGTNDAVLTDAAGTTVVSFIVQWNQRCGSY